MGIRFPRRDLLRAALAAAPATVVPLDMAGAPRGAGGGEQWMAGPGIFLTDSPGRPRRSTCAALCARIVPTGRDARRDPGATEAGAVRYIDWFLSAFKIPVALADQPVVYVHGRFSGDNPYPDNASGTPSRRFPPGDFIAPGGQHRFLPLTPHQRLSWRSRLYGRAAFAGATVSRTWLAQLGSLVPTPDAVPLRSIYAEGLDAFDAVARRRYGRELACATVGKQDLLLAAAAKASGSEPAAVSIPEAAARLFPHLVVHTFQACYSLPAYGGNRGRIMWQLIGWDGDTQPLGNSIYDAAAAEPGAGPNAGFGDPATFLPRGGYRQHRAVAGPG